MTRRIGPALLGFLLGLSACGDPPLSPAALPKDVHDVQIGTTDLGFAALDGASEETATPDTLDEDAVQDVAAPPGDAQGPETVADVAPSPDAAKPLDTGVQPFVFLSADPANGTANLAQPFTVTLQFNSKVKAEAAKATTIEVTTHGGTLVPGTFTAVEDKLTFTADAPISPASRIQMVLGTLVQAQKGASLQQAITLHWYVGPMANLAPYEKLAARYAPTLRQGVGSGDLQADSLRSLDFDGNWDASDNATNAATTAPLAQVGWSVIETQSHYFVTYVFFWPHRVAVAPAVALDNDVAGSLVTIAKWPKEHAIALTTYFKTKADEQMWLWVTQESGWPKSTFVRGVLPEAQLFPPSSDPNDTYGCEGLSDCTPRRYPGYLSAGSHQSCLWIDPGDSGLSLPTPLCLTSPQVKATLKWIDYLPGLQGQTATAAGNPGPTVTYGLQSLHGTWFAHRDEAGAGGLWVDTQFTYAPPAGRPQGPKIATGSKFQGKGDDFGRPPWAWMWNPKTNVSFYEMPRGTPFYDPAWATVQRLGGDKVLAGYDAAAKTGYSLDYCLHPFFFVDKRDTEPCKNALVP